MANEPEAPANNTTSFEKVRGLDDTITSIDKLS